jgi:hypothetical protein
MSPISNNGISESACLYQGMTSINPGFSIIYPFILNFSSPINISILTDS